MIGRQLNLNGWELLLTDTSREHNPADRELNLTHKELILTDRDKYLSD